MSIKYSIFIFSVLVFLQGCGEDHNLRLIDVSVIYINNTNHSIRYSQPFDDDSYLEVFQIAPMSTHTIEDRFSEVEDGDDNLEECCVGLFSGFQGKGELSDILVQFDDEKCLVFESGTGPTTDNLLEGYEARIVSDDVFEFKYTFTEEDYNKAIECEK